MGVRTATSRVGVLAALALLLGAVCALLWANLSVLPSYVLQADSHATITDPQLAEVFSANFHYAAIGLFGGIALGIAAWASLRSMGWPMALVTTGLALIAGVTCWLLGEVVGPGPFAPRMAAAEPGESVATALRLTTPSALAIWVFGAVAVPLFAASLGPEVDAPAPEVAARHD